MSNTLPSLKKKKKEREKNTFFLKKYLKII